MSRIGKKPIQVPEGVKVEVTGDTIAAKGPKGGLSCQVHDLVSVVLSQDQITVKPKNTTKEALSLWGTERSRINNLLIGVASGFEKKLQIIGVGYKAQIDGNHLTLFLGYSEETLYVIPDGVFVKVMGQKQDQLLVSGLDLQRVGQVSAEICSLRKADPYKGKGIRCTGDFVIRKQGKK